VQSTFLGPMQTVSTCPTCGGMGQTVSKRAPGSDEHGLVREEVVVNVKIPAGVEEGMQLNVSGMGNEAPAGGYPGDLLVVIEEEDHPELRAVASPAPRSLHEHGGRRLGHQHRSADW
jgi:molecular chaperone DnaJ